MIGWTRALEFQPGIRRHLLPPDHAMHKSLSRDRLSQPYNGQARPPQSGALFAQGPLGGSYPIAPRGQVRPPPPVGRRRIETNGAGGSAAGVVLRTLGSGLLAREGAPRRRAAARSLPLGGGSDPVTAAYPL